MCAQGRSEREKHKEINTEILTVKRNAMTAHGMLKFVCLCSHLISSFCMKKMKSGKMCSADQSAEGEHYKKKFPET